MKKFFYNLLFSILITLCMNGLDMTYHLATSWAVHLNYVAIKLAVIFLTTLLITQIIGKGKQEGAIISIFGPFIFYIYYLFANPTINRQIFLVDEQFWFFFLHLFFMLISYFSVLNLINSKKNWLKSLSIVILTSFSSIALDAIFIMSRWKLQGIEEETATALMSFNLISPLVIIFILTSVLFVLIRNKKIISNIISGLFSSILVFILTNDLLHSIFTFIVFNISSFMILNYKIEQPKKILSKLNWLIMALLTFIIGSFYEFIPRKIIKSISEFLIFDIIILNHRIRQNDLILIATIFLIISFVSFYKFYKLTYSKYSE